MQGVANGGGGAVAGLGGAGRRSARGDPAPRGASRNSVISRIRARAQTRSAFSVREVWRARRSCAVVFCALEC